MSDFIVKRLSYDLSSHAGLALIGKYLSHCNINALVDPAFPVRAGIANSSILKSYLGLLCLGKNDFDAIEGFRRDRFFAQAMKINTVPSSPTLRQRMDEQASSWFELAIQINEAVLSTRINGEPIKFGTVDGGYTPLDIDTFTMDNSGTSKELVSRTYAGVDGYCPIASYLGTQGYCLELALRPGSQHSALETGYDLERILPMASRLVDGPIVLRADSGFCSARLMANIKAQAQNLHRDIAFLIKWNPRTTPVETIAQNKVKDPSTPWHEEREGKRITLWEETVSIKEAGEARRVYRLTERTIDKHGQVMLLPEYKLEGWTTTLPQTFDAKQIIKLYADHATHEQYHSEFKTDMGLERLPSGKFDTNYLICQLAAVAMNLLRRIGQHTLHGEKAPVRHPAVRRRLKTVMQELMYRAARMIRHSRQWVLGLGHNDPSFDVFEQFHQNIQIA